ncbi:MULTISPECIES: hypothetical protein [Rhizobium/Agrobacterium group]|uniref:HEPN AbiU2-like domain-containing protein n=2 Tax=Rhizobium/Agrobacterium group TaxID=227290 RepID=B9JRK1_ALLAM|nr:MULTISPECIES: hypothetical protein [Rhizobium/Agrobacterium group]ACM35478.1 hypothetical protein Avi_0673 [Allorhizobium ampelinum S4]MUO28269.1 hypothetical protein [Agrobacterium vitis]MUO40697.1 hypothetical protein [Agrobacterium vitis]MUP12764.1 hypothetical protein [Agrobacterium vitis]
MGIQADKQMKLRIQTWREAFRDETTGILKTVDDLIWNYAAFRTAIRVVYLANQRDRERPPINQMLFNLISNGYWSSLLLGVRRLLDKGAIKGGQGVYSIRAVLEDIKACRAKLPRRVYVEVLRDCRYDLAKLEEEHWETLKAANGKPVWGDPALSLSQMAHQHFDILSGISADNRGPNDLISGDIFDRLENRLAALDRINDHVSSHLAHAGNRESRQGKLLDEFDIRDSRETLKELVQAAHLVGVWFANEGGAGLATYIGDQFEGLDTALVFPEDMSDLKKNWEAIRHDVDSWHIEVDDL